MEQEYREKLHQMQQQFEQKHSSICGEMSNERVVWIANMSGSGRMQLVMLPLDSKKICIA